MKQIIADTNLFLRFILKDNIKEYKIAEELFQEAKERKVKLIVSQIVIFEIVFSLEKYYRFPKFDVIDRLKSLIPARYLFIQNRVVFKSAIKLFESSNNSFVDCFLVAKAKNAQAELFTFDIGMKKLFERSVG